MFYVYEKDTTYIIGKNGTPDHRASYKTMAAAKAAVTRMDRKWLMKEFYEEGIDSPTRPLFRFGIAEAAYFHERIEKKVKRQVLEGFGGKEYYEPVNTPNYCSPSSESYWSM